MRFHWHSLPLLAWSPVLGCGSSLTIAHEQALAGQYRDVRLGDEAADVHARFAEPRQPIGSSVVRQVFSDRAVLDQLEMPANATFRDVTEGAQIRVLFIERPAGAPDSAMLVIATTTAARTLYDSEGATVYDAVLTASGVVVAEAAAGTCSLRWLNDSGSQEGAVSLDAGVCTDELRLAPGRPGSAIGYTNGTISGVAFPDRNNSWTGGGDLITWDPVSSAIVVARKGETEIRAWLDDGTEAWYTDIGQAIEDADSMGAEGAIALATTVGSNGRVVLLDSVTGNALTAIDVPVPGRELSAGTAGTHLALALDEELHLFRVNFSGAR